MLLSTVSQRGTRAAQPAANTIPAGGIYYVTDESKLERSTGAAWQDISSGGGAGGAWTTVVKANTTTRSATVTITNDPDLTFAMAASKKYAIRMFILVQTSSVPDFAYRFTGPASPTLVALRRESSPPPGTAIVDSFDIAYPVADLTLQGAGTDAVGFIKMEGVIINGVNAGTFALPWSQRVSDVGNTSVLAGSYLEYAEKT